MWALLSPRFWIGLALVGALSFTHFFVYRAGAANVRAKWESSIRAANAEARKIEQRRQDRADEAMRLAATRKIRLVADAAGASGELERLRHAYAARDVAEESATAATKRADTAEKLLIESAGAYQELARAADGHVNDVQTLLDAWPK